MVYLKLLQCTLVQSAAIVVLVAVVVAAAVIASAADFLVTPSWPAPF